MSKIKRGWLIAVCACALVVLGSMSYSDAQDQQDEYCQMVADGHWPNFKPNIDCKVGKE